MLPKRMVESNEQIFRLQLFNKILTRWRQAVSVQLLGRRNNPLSFFHFSLLLQEKKSVSSFIIPLSPLSLSLLPPSLSLISPSLSLLSLQHLFSWLNIYSLAQFIVVVVVVVFKKCFSFQTQLSVFVWQSSEWIFLFLRHSSGKIPVLATVPVQ